MTKGTTSAARLAAVVESSDDGIIGTDLDGNVLDWNAAAERLYGYSAEEIVGRSISILVPQERAREPQDLISRVRSGERIERHDTVLVCKDGRRARASLTVSPIRDAHGAIVGASAIARDVTEERRTRETAARLAAIVESSYDAIVGLTPDGVITSWNAAAERQYGYASDEIVGKSVAVLAPRDRPDEVAAILRRVSGGERVGHFETVREGRNGRLIDVSLTVSPVLDARGGVVGAAMVARDITAEKQLEEERQRALRMEKVGHLAAAIAHDFNNLLTVINGFSNVLEKELGADSAGGHAAHQIGQAGGKAAALVQQLLAYSREQVLRPSVVSLNEVVANASHIAEAVLGEDVRLEVKLSPECGYVVVDGEQLEQAVVSLALNARDGMLEDRRVSIETSLADLDAAERARLRLGAGPYVAVTVADHGSGMDAATRDRAFEPFFTTKGIGQGAGLGLPSVKGFIEQTGGRVTLWSEPGEGTRVTLLLPRAAAAAPIAPFDGGARTTPEHDAGDVAETILVVDDDDGVRALAALTLAEEFGVLEASSGSEALEIVERRGRDISLVVTDVVMPELNGAELASRLAVVLPDVPVLFMSGYSGDALTERGVLRPEAELLEKPFAPDELVRRVHELLDAKAAALASPFPARGYTR